MKIDHVLASSMAVLASDKATRHGAYSFFTFGDSYTTTGFNTSDLQPTMGNPMGNPALGQGTTAGGVNWVGYMTTMYNSSVVLNYNMAVYGATVNDSIVDNEPEDLVYQVSRNFRGHYCTPSESGPASSLPAALFAIWIGINDVQFSYLDADPYRKIPFTLQSYFHLMQEMYDCGARQFLLLNVPPTSRTPTMLLAEPWRRNIHNRVVREFNRQLQEAISDWRTTHEDTVVTHYDAWSFMTKILDDSNGYGFKNNRCIGAGCVWWDGYHPNSAFHRLMAADIATHVSHTYPVLL